MPTDSPSTKLQNSVFFSESNPNTNKSHVKHTIGDVNLLLLSSDFS